MSWIKELEMQGFKSFANKTKIVFNRNLSVIVGPNGSGKSNICDALLFVLGHVSKKEMRAEKLDHLIFNGGKTDKPAKFARVSITLDNSEKDFPFDAKEVIISRAVDRNGTSVYRLNGERVTKAEVANVLDSVNIRPDGFNIILQGAIARFVELRSDERKALIEELSGIASFDEKKKKSVSELEGVQDKIKEVSIILKEKEGHLKELLADKTTAEKFVKLEKKKRYLEGQVVLKRLEEVSRSEEAIKNSIEEKKTELAKIIEESKGLSDAVVALENEKKELGIEIEKRGEKESVKLNKEIEDLRIALTSQEQQIELKKNELKRMDERKKQVKEEIERNQKNLSESQKEQAKLERDIEKIAEEISKVSKEVDRNKHIEDIFETRKKIDNIKLNIEKLNTEIESALKNENVLEQQNKIENEVRRMRAKHDNIEAMLSKEKKLDVQTKEKINEVDSYINHIIKKIAQLEERKNVYKEMLDEGTKEILKLRDSGKINGIYGTFTEICNIPARYSTAFRVAAGENINTVMVEDIATAKKCIDYLKQYKLGVARFLPIKNISVKKTRIKPVAVGVIDFASNLVGTDAKFKNAVEWIMDDTLIVDKIDALHESELRVVSIEGDFVHNKIVSGGHRSDVIIFRDENIEAEYQKVVAELSKYRSYKDKLTEQIEKNKALIEKLVEDITTAKNRLQELEREYSNLRGEYKDENIDVKKNKTTIQQLEREKYELEELMHLRATSLSAESEKQAENKLKEFTEARNTFVIKLNTIRAESKNIIERDIERLQKICEDIVKSEEEFRQHISELNAKVYNGRNELKQKYEEQKVFFKSLRDITNRRENVIKSIEKSKIEIFRLEKKSDGIDKDIGYSNLKKAEIVGKIEGLKQQFKEFERDGIQQSKSGLEALEKEFEDVRKMLQDFGPVNMKALETYRIVEEEFNLLKAKVTVLETERQKVLDMILDIESKKLNVFMETFSHISDKFSETFALLSENGQASLILENKDSPLDGGIDMIARPAGKKLTSISALSGGEKTLVTLSFIFAIQEYHPAPFYVMDEIDSALDKTNSERLSDLVRAYSKSAQFIIVSHNDELVAAADYLYGVSMKENAVSQVMSIKLPPIEEKK